MYLIPALRIKGGKFSEFEVNLVYVTCSRIARRDLVLKQK